MSHTAKPKEGFLIQCFPKTNLFCSLIMQVDGSWIDRSAVRNGCNNTRNRNSSITKLIYDQGLQCNSIKVRSNPFGTQYNMNSTEIIIKVSSAEELQHLIDLRSEEHTSELQSQS